jgi:Ni/Co efflux regulator RcnB
VPNQWYGHRWTSGEYLPDYFYDYRIYDYLSYGLPTPPYDCAYYFIGRDVVLVDMSTGEIIDVFYDVY